uniref:CSON001978 protein n=1 Tax=Culicoides sonorensis TaxID=179676 RepID=A0A336K6X9_CULSO
MKDVEFQDVVYRVTHRESFLSEARTRTLLKGVSGTFRHGELSAIMGPSGAGKSTLLNALSGFKGNGAQGIIQVDRKTSCYITQEDLHQPLVTVEEMMKIACKLKLKPGSDHKTIIDEVLTNLGLNHRRNVKAERLSGGERKRLSVALELVSNPGIFFLDEPTSGLDEVTAAQCIRQLRDLAKQDRTVVCTIHQPSAAIFALFDHIYIIAQGQCVYQGAPKALVPFLSHVNINCPRHYNPADFIIELCDSDENEKIIPLFSEIFQNGKLICTIPSTINNLEHQQYRIKPALTHMVMEKNKSKEGPLVQKMKQITKFLKNDSATSGIKQFAILFNLMMLKTFRNKTALAIQLFHHLLCGLFIGIIFFQLADEGERMFDHLKFCMGVVFFTVYTQIMTPILSYPSEVKLVKKECFNRWYGLVPYYLALTFSRIPLQIAFNVIFSSLVYWLAGLPAEIWRFVAFAFIGVIICLVADGLGLLIGATFSVTNGCAVGPMFMAPFLGLAVYGFDFAEKIPFYMDILMRLSFVRGGIVSLVLTVFGYGRQQLACKDLYCHFDDPKVLLRYLRIENRSLWGELAVLIAICVLFRTLLYMSLRRRCLA